MKRPKVYDPLIWLLFEDVERSVVSLSNQYLIRSAKNAAQVLLCVRFYFAGIRNNNAFKFWFCPERIESTLLKLFPGLDYTQLRFDFKFYTHRTTKWCRKCQEHARLVEDFLRRAIEEIDYRSLNFATADFASYLANDYRVSEQMPSAHLKKIIPEWKNIPPKYRENDVYKAMRRYYSSRICDVAQEYANSRRDIPDFLIRKNIDEL